MSSYTSTSDKGSRSVGRFAFWFALPSLILFVALFLVLQVEREWFTTSDGLRAQLREQGIYGRSVLADDHHYKVLLYNERRPTILALGSSRTMQFREELFAGGERFVTAGGAMASVEEGTRFVRETFAAHHPDLVVLGVDYWWFNEASTIGGDRANGDDMYESYLYLLASGVSSSARLFEHFIRRSDGTALVPPLARHRAVGSRAWAFGDGFRLDGSYNAAAVLHAAVDESVADKDYRTTLRRVQNETHPFEGGARAVERMITDFGGLVELIRGYGTKVTMFMPPFSPDVYRALASSPRHAVFQDVRRRLGEVAAAKGVSFEDASLMPFEDRRCYLDGFHGGYQLYAEIARRLVPTNRLDPRELGRLALVPGGPCVVVE